MEKYDINEGNEALKRVLLMMKYDDKKTLTENVGELDEQNRGYVATGSAAGGAALGVGAAALGAGTLAGGSVGTTAMAVGGALGAASGGGTALALGSAVLGGAAALAVLPLAYWLITKDDGKNRVEKIFKYCSTDKSKISKIKRGVNDTTIRDLSDKIYDSVEGVGTDEEAIYSALGQLKTASDFCALIDRYTKDNGDLFEELDSDIDDQSEWDKIYRPIRNCVEDTLLSIKDEEKGKELIKKGGGKSKGKCPTVTNTGVSYDYQYPGDAKYVYGIKDKQWYAKNVSTGKEFNITKCYPDMVKKLNTGVTKITSTPTPTPTPKIEDLGISNTSDLGNEDLIDNNKPFK